MPLRPGHREPGRRSPRPAVARAVSLPQGRARRRVPGPVRTVRAGHGRRRRRRLLPGGPGGRCAAVASPAQLPRQPLKFPTVAVPDERLPPIEVATVRLAGHTTAEPFEVALDDGAPLLQAGRGQTAGEPAMEPPGPPL